MNEPGLDVASGKGRGDENFPVGSRLLRPSDRPHVHAYYGFARAIDDIADNTVLSPDAKIARLDAMESMLLGRSLDSGADPGSDPGSNPGSPGAELEKARRLRDSMVITGIDPATGTDLIVAFRQDAVKRRYESWEELADYCRYSAAPVGRYLLSLHGEELRGAGGAALLAASDALCAALQVLNHLQDCADDLAGLDRCYIPVPWLAEAGLGVAVLRCVHSPPGLRRVLDRLLDKVDDLNRQAAVLPSLVSDRRMRLEASVIVGLSHRLSSRLRREDPLASRVKLRPLDMARSLSGAAWHFWRR